MFEAAYEFLAATWRVTVSLAPWLLLGSAIAGLLEALLPTGFLRRRLRGRSGVVKAVLLGVPLPLCSCGVIPTGLGLRKQGAGDGATVAFLISTPQTGVDSVVVTSMVLGWPFALFKVASAAVTGVIGGWLAGAVAEEATALAVVSEQRAARPNRWRAGWEHAIEMIRSIWYWIVGGVLISASLTVWLPEGSLGALGGYGGLWGMLAALALSLPLYVCATASAPIAAALVAAGLPPSAALVFLMAGPATNVPAIGAIYRTLGRRQLGVYLATIIVGSMLGGLLFDWLLPGGVIDASSAARAPHDHAGHGPDGNAWWAVGSAYALLALLAWFAIDDARRGFSKQPADASLPAIDLGVEGMSCAGCVSKLEKTVAAEPSVDSVRATLNPGHVTAHGTVTPQRLRELVRAAGFSPR